MDGMKNLQREIKEMTGKEEVSLVPRRGPVGTIRRGTRSTLLGAPENETAAELEEKIENIEEEIQKKKEKIEDLEDSITDQEHAVEEQKRKVNRLLKEAKMTPEQRARIQNLEEQIANKQTQITSLEEEVTKKEGQLKLAQKKVDQLKQTLTSLQDKLHVFEKSILPRLKVLNNPGPRGAAPEADISLIEKTRFPTSWVQNGLPRPGGKYSYLVFWLHGYEPPYLGTGRGTHPGRMVGLIVEIADELIKEGIELDENRLNCIRRYAWSGDDPRDIRSGTIRGCGIHRLFPSMVEKAQNLASNLRAQIQDVNSKLSAATNEVNTIQYELNSAKSQLEFAQRSLNDLQNTLHTVRSEIRGNIQWKKGQLRDAQERLKLEQRQLRNLRDTVEMLRAEIKEAQKKAEAFAAKHDELLLKAKQEERIQLAEKYRKLAEEAKAAAEKTAGVEREKWLEKQKELEKIAQDAYEASKKAAEESYWKRMEATATEAELATMRSELEEKRRRLTELRSELQNLQITTGQTPTVTPEVPEVAAKIPTWGWWLAGIGGVSVLGVGIAYAIKGKRGK